MEDHRGRHRVKIFNDNRDAVRKWLKENPKETMKKCSIDLGLS